MNTRNSEYAISGIRYDVDNCRVYKFRVHRIKAGEVGAPMEISRGQLISAVGHGTTFLVACVDGEGRVQRQAPLRLVHVDGLPYLRCDEDGVPADDFPGVTRF